MKEKIAWIANGGGMFLTIIQTNQIFQIVSLILTCIATALSIGITLYNLFKKAKEGNLEASDLEKAKEEIEKLKEQLQEKENEE